MQNTPNTYQNGKNVRSVMALMSLYMPRTTSSEIRAHKLLAFLLGRRIHD